MPFKEKGSKVLVMGIQKGTVRREQKPEEKVKGFPHLRSNIQPVFCAPTWIRANNVKTFRSLEDVPTCTLKREWMDIERRKKNKLKK